MKEVMSYIGLLPHPAERIDRGATWSDPEVDELLNIWTNENVQAELKEATIKKHIFERIARNLREKGFYRTAEQCREKIKRLKKEYRQAKNNNYRCVRGRATVKFFPRLQAVLDGRPNPKTFYDGTEFGGAGGDGVVVGGSFGLHPKSSPHSFAEYSSEEIKVEINPAEVDNDSYVASEPGEPDTDMVEQPPPAAPPPQATPSSIKHPRHHHHHHHHHPLHHLQSQHHQHSNRHGSPHSTIHANATSLHQPITISIPHAHHHHLNSSTGNGNAGGNSNNNGILEGSGRLKDDPECLSDASSSRMTSPNMLTPTPQSPSSSSVYLRRRRLKKNRASLSTQALKETLDLTLDRFLKHQRESEERLFAWEERRIQMELEAEERWRQEDREMLRQILSHLQRFPSNSYPSPPSGSQSNSLHDH